MSNRHRFRKKLEGATARLFAAVCEHYVDSALSSCNDTPAFIPIFSRLSPQHRVKLVRDVAVGLLCENESLPPNTIQHACAYHAMIETISTEIEIEDEKACDNYLDIRDDFKQLEDEFTCQRNSREVRSKEEQEEREGIFKSIEARAARNKRKLERKKDSKKAENFKVEEKSDLERVQSGVRKIAEIMSNEIFRGSPISQEERNSFLPLTEDEEYAFRWRLLVDQALQERTTPLGQGLGPIALIPPLSQVNFDFRCGNISKWNEVLSLLLLFDVYEDNSPTERGLISGEIDFRTYADPSQHARIVAVDKQVETLRAVYDKTWDPKSVGDDQRCIYAVCSNEPYCTKEHRNWTNDYLTRCTQSDITWSERGNFQARYDIYKELKPLHTGEGLECPFQLQSEPWTPPAEYVDEFASHLQVTYCSGPGNRDKMFKDKMFSALGCSNTQNLRKCAGCKTVSYCSRKCQLDDWPNHKKVCKSMAKLRKDKNMVAELAKEV